APPAPPAAAAARGRAPAHPAHARGRAQCLPIAPLAVAAQRNPPIPNSLPGAGARAAAPRLRAAGA
nr:hypothetical protein [Tanacetum cinerariifolium]